MEMCDEFLNFNALLFTRIDYVKIKYYNIQVVCMKRCILNAGQHYSSELVLLVRMSVG